MPRSELKVSLGYASDKGLKAENEDFYGCMTPSGNQLIHKGIAAAIADGISGCHAGKQASHCSVVSFLTDYYSTPDSWSVQLAGQKVLAATNSWLYTQGMVRQAGKGMLSTLSTLVLKSTTAHIFHIGDSRIYRLRQGYLEQLTRDHRIGLSEEKSYLNRAMGAEPCLEVDYRAIPLQKGDLFLMTTDGIHDFVDEKNIKQLLAHIENLPQTAQQILDCALNNHSDDNLTCQLVRIDELPNVGQDELIRRYANLPFPPPLSPGMVLDGYRIEAEIHSSKRTHIYQAIDTQSQHKVILKAPSVLYDEDSYFREHFLHEEWIGKRIWHENVLAVLDANREKSCVYYVTEFLEGPTLRDWMQSHPKADIKQVCIIIQQIAKGLRAFHRMEMLHQDLKPENIMFDSQGMVKIIDFGSVKIAGVAETKYLADDDNNILGTLNYTAPEYHTGQTGTTKSDLYSLGVVLYEMLNGALPFGMMPEKPSIKNLSTLEYVPSFHYNPMVPVWLDGALKKATAINPISRYDEISEFLHDLTHPNPKFLINQPPNPLIQRNPLLFWKLLCLFLLLSNFISLYGLVT